MSGALLATVAGLISGGALLVGAAVAWFVRVPRGIVAIVMAFGAGVLISALAFDLVAPATEDGSLWSAMAGFLTGAVVYVGLDLLLERWSRQKRKDARHGASASGLAIALGALLDGIPETAVQGVQLAGGGSLPLAILVAVVISNLPEGLASTADMKQNGRGAGYVFGTWGAIALVCAASALAGYALLGDAPGAVRSFVTAIAAGAILAMLADSMLPEAFRKAGTWTGLVTVLGFFASFAVHSLGG